MTKTGQFLAPLRSIHARIRDAVVDACQRASEGELSRVVADGEGDTIYAVDRVSEELLVELFEREIATIAPIVLIAEGLPGGQIVLPRGTRPESAEWRIIADPVDGTRCLMYQKRSGWILTGIAPNLG
jgi:fructose-1,6-bisphosphatase/inositol monophosphatase family enzyme